MSAPDEQAYDGELAMLRGLVRVLRTVVREEQTLPEVRRLLWQHASDDAAAREGKSSRPAADATPSKADRVEARLAQLLDTIRTHGGKWSTSTLLEVRRRDGGSTQRGAARRDLAELHRRGHLNQHGAGDGRFYTLKTRKDDAR